MPKSLSNAQIKQYGDAGYVSPLDALSAAEARDLRTRLESFEALRGGTLPRDEQRKMHLSLRWVDELVRHPRILDAVEDVIGPDILLYHITLWIKPPRSDAFISWHQDLTYFGLSPDDRHVTAWIALAPSTIESGCVQVLRGSHLRGQIPHGVELTASNMLRTGQQIPVAADAPYEIMELQPGQFSLHHTHLIHNSLANRSDDRRIGLGISYIPTECRCISRTRLSAMLVRGQDRFGHFDAEERPAADLDRRAMENHAAAMAKWHQAREELIALAHRQIA